MVIKYKGVGNLSSQNINFNPSQKEYTVTTEVAEYLVKTFPSLFEKVKKEETVKEIAPVIQEEVKESKRVKPSSKVK